MLGKPEIYSLRADDTLVDLARDRGLGYVELVAANPGVDPWIPPEDVEVVLPHAHILPAAPRNGIVINLADQRLYYFPEDDRPQSFAIGVGRQGYETPLGATKVIGKRKDPTWTPPASARADDPSLPAVVPPGPENPLGNRALYLEWPAYLIHGTNEPYGIGRRVSRGCIRLYPEDIEHLFDAVESGTVVHVVDQPIKVGWSRGELYLEAHPSLSQASEIEEGAKISYEEAPGA
jgi:L,D-transpeptidase ErfK/SrfK